MTWSVVNWTVRVAMMVLAGLVSLSILGAVATMTTDTGPRGFLVESQPQPLPGTIPEERASESAQTDPGNVFAPGERQEAASSSGTGSAVVAAPPPPEDRSERWLEAIAYALLALAGLAAIAILLLWRLVRELRRIADARG